jgi:hypothetical protein
MPALVLPHRYPRSTRCLLAQHKIQTNQWKDETQKEKKINRKENDRNEMVYP